MSFFLNSYSFSLPPAAACDLFWNKVQLLLVDDTTDSSTAARTALGYGGTTASSVGGYDATYFDGVNDNLEYPNTLTLSRALTLGGGTDAQGALDFTVEAWVYISSTYTPYYLYIHGQSGSGTGSDTAERGGISMVISKTSADIIAGNLSSDGFSYYLHRKVALSLSDGWHHVAFQSLAGNPSIYIDGVAQTLTFGNGSSTVTTLSICKCYSTRNVQIMSFGAHGGVTDTTNGTAAYFKAGYIRNYRITREFARYSADFTPSLDALGTTQCAYTGWTPANGTAPYAWYITDDPANTVTGGNTLTVLVDKSGNGRNISTSLDYAAGAIHSRAAAATGFGGKRLTLPSSTGMLNGAAGWCAAFSLYRIDGGAMSQALFFAETNALNTSRALLAVEGPTDDKPRIVSRRADGDTAAVLDSSVTVGHQDYALVVGGVDLPSKVARILANGVETISAPFGTTGNTFSATNSYSGPYLLDTNASGGGGSEQYIGNVGEIVLYNSAISLAEMRKLEGYLAWTWGMLDKLPSDHPYRTTQPQADASWTPAAEPSVLVWLDATDASTVTLTSSEVTNLASKGNISGVNAVPVLAGTRPEYATAVVNGKNVLRFNGTSDGMYVTGITGATMTDLFRNRQSGWAIAAYASNPSMSSATPKCVFFVNRNNAVEYTRFSLMQSQATANSPAMAARRLDADAYQSIEGTTNHGLDWLIAVAHADWQNSDGYLWVNGSSAASTTSLQTAGNTSDTASISSPHLGCAGDTGGSGIQQFMQGDLAHLIVGVGPLTTDMRQKIEGYLAHQLGLTGSLPGGHPYKAVAP